MFRGYTLREPFFRKVATADDGRPHAGLPSPKLPMTARQGLRLLLVGLGTSVVPLDTAVNIGFPAITGSFSLPIQMIQWVVICYVLTYASLMLAFGRVGDIFSHGRVFRIGLWWSSAAYLLCALAPRYGRLHGHVRDRLCSRAATRRGARSTLGLASRILVSCPDRVHGASVPRGAPGGISRRCARAG